ncbi:hypothetical protein TGVAND_312700B, partial [Toxoplasma gondii VAND]
MSLLRFASMFIDFSFGWAPAPFDCGAQRAFERRGVSSASPPPSRLELHRSWEVRLDVL